MALFTLVACGSEKTKMEKQISIEEMKSKRSDLIYLDYKFGMNQTEVQKHTENLIAEKKIDENGFIELDLGGSLMKINGSKNTFLVKDYICKSIFQIIYVNNKVSQLDLILYQFPKNYETVLVDVIELFESKYGKSTRVSDIIPIEDIENMKYYTQDQNKAIYISEAMGLVSISYIDLISKGELKEKNTSDSERIKNENLAKSKQTKGQI